MVCPTFILTIASATLIWSSILLHLEFSKQQMVGQLTVFAWISSLRLRFYHLKIKKLTWFITQKLSVPVDFLNLLKITSTLSAQEYKFDLDSITGDVSHLLVLVRPSGTNTQTLTVNHRYTDIGFDGSVDIQNSSGKSMLGNGNPVPYGFLNSEVFNSHLSTDWNSFKNAIIIPFCNNITSSHHGVKDNYLALRGQRHYVAITPNIVSWVNGTYDVYIYAFIHRTLATQNGRFSTVDDHS